jgi:hypothetical protein
MYQQLAVSYDLKGNTTKATKLRSKIKIPTNKS